LDKTHNNHKLIDYIDGAKDWLDKAKTEYNQANPVGGELILNLAQAEIKYAWELSRSNYVSDSKKPVGKPLRTYKFKLILPVAASIIGLLGFGWWIMSGLHTVKNTPAFTENQSAVLKEKPTHTGRNQNAALVENPSPGVDQPTINQLALGNKPDPMITEPLTLETTGQPAGDRRQIENATSSRQTGIKESTSQFNLQPVSKLVIDEEALTEEASHSLRNGK
jgi:hypothetical protein